MSQDPDMERIIFDTMETKVFLKQRIESAMSQAIDRLEARRKGGCGTARHDAGHGWHLRKIRHRGGENGISAGS